MEVERTPGYVLRASEKEWDVLMLALVIATDTNVDFPDLPLMRRLRKEMEDSEGR